MKTWQKISLKVLLALTLTTAGIYLFAPWQFGLYYLKDLPNDIQAELALATDNGLDGIIVYVQKGDETANTYAAGWHNRANQIPARTDALFKIASIAKLYDAAALTKLVGEGKLDLDKSLAHYLPEYAERIENAGGISLRMMVQHRSGIPNFTDQEGFDWSSDKIDIYSLFLDKPADFAPDSDYKYSNTNYLLLQSIMSRALGYSYTRYINEAILEPLDLHDTFFSVHEVDKDKLMSGYYVGYENDFKDLDQGYIATAHDVGVFLKALNKGTIFSPEEMQLYKSIYEFNHTGWVLGYSSIARYHPDIDSVVVQFTNTTGNDTVILTGIVYDRVMEIIKG